MDVTLGEGMPAVWCEFTGVQPVIALGGHGGKGSRGKNAATFFDLAGKAAHAARDGRRAGHHLRGPRRTACSRRTGRSSSRRRDGIAVTFAGKSAFLVVCPLPAEKDIAHVPPARLRRAARHAALVELRPQRGHHHDDVESHRRAAQGHEQERHPGLAAASLARQHEPRSTFNGIAATRRFAAR